MLLHLFVVYVTLFFRIPGLSFSISCHKDLKLNWTVSISDSPIVSAPVLVKSSSDLYSNQLIVSTHDGSVSIINTASGEEETPWPVHFPEKAFFAGPLIYDIDQDGSMDILLTTSDGEIMFLSRNGTSLPSQSIFLPRLLVKRNWNILTMEVIVDKKRKPDMNPSSNTMFIPLQKLESDYQDNLSKIYLPLETHILSTPVIGDFNGDGINSELIVPVNFYFEDDIKKDPERLGSLSLEESEVDFYLANGIIVIDLRTREIIFNTTLELTMKSSSFPGYLLSSPTIVDLEGENGELEVLIGSMSGKIHVYNKARKYSQDFGLSDAIHGEITVGDINNDGKLEVIAVDGSGNVVCYDNQKIIWEATVSGTITAGAQLQDINQDNRPEVVIATNDGYVWILDGETGHILPNWPLKLGDKIHSKVMFNKHSDQSVDIIVMADGNMNIIGASNLCLEVIPTEVISYVPVIFDANHMAFIVLTTEGKVLSFQQQNKNITFTPHQQTSIRFVEIINDITLVTTDSFSVQYEIYDNQDLKHRWKSYTVTVCFPTEKGIGHIASSHDTPGVYSVTLRAPQAPKKSYVLLELCNQFKYCTEDIRYFTFYPKTQQSLVLYVILPFLVMVALLLVLHGYPEGNLIPMWVRTNSD